MTRDQQPFACDGSVTFEKLQELLAVQTEVEGLDFKEYLDLGERRDQVELIKDIAAMQSMPQGGYIVVGVDGQGCPSTAHGALQATVFDEARLRGIARTCLPEPLTLRSQTHDVGNVTVALIYVGPNPAGFCIVEKDGEYQDARGQKRTILRAGDVFVRRGTSSARWQQADLPSLLAGWENRVREDERRNVADVLRRADQGRRGVELAEAPIGALTWRLDQADFDSVVIELLRRGDRHATRTMLLPIASEAATIFKEGPAEDLEVILDRLISVAGAAITYDSPDVLNQALGALHRIYGIPTVATEVAAHLWLGVASRVEAAGALAVRLEQWWAIRPLTLRPVTTGHESYMSWLRHAVTMGARTNQLVNADGRPVSGAFASFGRLAAARIPALRPDLAGAVAPFEVGAPPEDYDVLLDSITQFDLLWCVLMAVVAPRQLSLYPSFAGFYERRAEPVLQTLVTDKEVQREVLGDVSDEDLRRALEEVLHLAEQESFRMRSRPWQVDATYLRRLLGD